MPIRLVYYPPYHSKYNPVERFWAALEKYWKPLILDTVSNTLNIAKRVVYKGVNPIVTFIDKVYETGIKVPKEEMEQIQLFISRNPSLSLWDVLIQPDETG